MEAADRSHRILSENKDKLHRLADALLEREILDGDEIDRIMKGEEFVANASKKAAKSKAVKTKAARIKKKKAKKEDLSPEGGEEPSPATA